MMSVCLFLLFATALAITPAAALETVLVTARKLPEHADDVPGQLTVVDRQALDLHDVDRLDDYVRLDPALQRIRNGNDQQTLLLMRGLGNYGDSEPSIGVFDDGIYQSAGAQASAPAFDLERIEVLHGPQGTLYGKGTTAGAINRVRRRPTHALVMGASGIGTSDGLAGTEGFVSGPLAGSTLAARGAWYYRNFDGFFRDALSGAPIDDDEQAAGRVMLSWQPSARLDALLTLSARDQTQGGFVMRPARDTRDFDGNEFARDRHNDFRTTSLGGDLQVAWHGAGYTLESITAAHTVTQDFAIDLDYSPSPLLFAARNDERADFSQELRVASSRQSALRWLLGLYYLEVQGDYAQHVRARGPHGPLLAAVDSENRARTASVFGLVEVPITNGWYAGSAWRYDHERRRELTAAGTRRAQWADISASIDLGWRQGQPEAERLHVYARATRTFKPGGFNRGSTIHFDKETTLGAELGVKWQPHPRIALAGALYRTHVRQAQNLDIDPATFADVTVNKGRVRIAGLELRARWQPLANLTLEASGNWLDADYDDYRPLRVGPRGLRRYDLSGNRLQWVSEYQLHGSAEYRRRVRLANRDLSAYVLLDAAISGPRPWEDFNRNVSPREDLVNLRGGLETRRWRFAVFVENLLDEDYFTNYVAGFRFPFAGGTDLAAPGRPRQIGVRLALSY